VRTTPRSPTRRHSFQPRLEILEDRSLLSATIAEFSLPVFADPLAITADKFGNIWFTELNNRRIGEIDHSTHAVAEFPLPTPTLFPEGITTDKDGNVWFTEKDEFPFTPDNKIGKITLNGDGSYSISEPIDLSTIEPTGRHIPFVHFGPVGITADKNGNIWFTDTYDFIGRIEYGTSHVTTFGPLEPLRQLSTPGEITEGPDGNLWFTETFGNEPFGETDADIGKITPDGQITNYPLPPSTQSRGLASITAGPDGKLWFTETFVNTIGNITTDGTITEIPNVLAGGHTPIEITAGPDGNLWFTDGVGKIYVMTTAGAVISQYSAPSGGSYGITASPDGNIWFTEPNAGKIGAILINQTTTMTAVASSSNPSAYGEPVTFTATVTANAASAATPGGTVIFTEGANTLGSAPLDGSGHASFTTSFLGPGSHTITATYGGDFHFSGSAGSVTQTVNLIPTGPVEPGQTAAIGFWQGPNGQKLIRSLNGGQDSTQLGDWLAQTFPNMYSAAAGTHNLAGMSNTQVADFVTALFSQTASSAPPGPPKLDAQVLAVALSAYVTNQNLAGMTAAAYGFQVSAEGLAAATFNVGSDGAAFGVANDTTMTIFALLQATDAQTHNGLLYDTDGSGTISPLEKALRVMANQVYTAI
jgi:virginiamycin B lyase